MRAEVIHVGVCNKGRVEFMKARGIFDADVLPRIGIEG